jgi:hypothetical protein
MLYQLYVFHSVSWIVVWFAVLHGVVWAARCLHNSWSGCKGKSSERVLLAARPSEDCSGVDGGYVCAAWMRQFVWWCFVPELL